MGKISPVQAMDSPGAAFGDLTPSPARSPGPVAVPTNTAVNWQLVHSKGANKLHVAFHCAERDC